MFSRHLDDDALWKIFSVLNSSDMLLSVVGASTQIPSDVISPRGRRNHISPHTRPTLVLFILIPKQITGIAIPLLHGAVVITSEKRPLCTCKTEWPLFVLPISWYFQHHYCTHAQTALRRRQIGVILHVKFQYIFFSFSWPSPFTHSTRKYRTLIRDSSSKRVSPSFLISNITLSWYSPGVSAGTCIFLSM